MQDTVPRMSTILMMAAKLVTQTSLSRYEMPQVALNCGIMLRECIRHEPLAKIVLQSDHFHSFFNYVEMSTFDIASDAFATFKVGQAKPSRGYTESTYWAICFVGWGGGIG